MPRLTLFTLILFSAISLKAQYTSVSAREIVRIKALPTDSYDSIFGRDHFLATIKKQAAQYLSEEPHPIDTLRSQGLLMGDPRKTATWSALADMTKMYVLALQYRFGHDEKYLHKATVFLKTWATQNGPEGDPINDTNLDGAIQTYDLIKEALSPADNTLIKNWLARTASQEISSRFNSPKNFTSYNNWNSHRLKVLGEIAFAIGDTALQSYTVAGLKRQIEKNLNPDGTCIDFVQRDALHYHVYDIDPLIRLCIVLYRATGVDYYSWQAANGASVKKSVEWVRPYLEGTKTHAEFVNSKEKFDRDRAKNNEKDYQPGRLFEPIEGAQTLILASYFDGNISFKAENLYREAKTHPSPLLQMIVLSVLAR